MASSGLISSLGTAELPTTLYFNTYPEHEEAYKIIDVNPGITKADLARKMGKHDSSQIAYILTGLSYALERSWGLLAEDDEGRLFIVHV